MGTLPVLVPLQVLREREGKLPGLPGLITQLLRGPGETLAADLGKRLCERGRLLFLLDGLDEVADTAQRLEVKEWIEQAERTMPDCYFVVSCRYAGYAPVEFDTRFLELKLRPFNDAQMEAFVRNWYGIVERSLVSDASLAEARGKAHADELLGVLNDATFSSVARLYEMSRNPLMLTTICLVHHDKGGLPRARAALYKDSIAVLLERWQGRRRSDKVPLSSDQALEVLQPVAWWMHGVEGRRRAKESELLGPVRQALVTLGQPEAMAAEFLAVVRDSSGVLTGFGVDEYGFMHLGLQEYLVAQHLRLAGHADPREFDELATKFDEPWWREVILLMLGQHSPRVFEPFMRALLNHPRAALWVDSELMQLCWREAASPSARPLLDVLSERDERGAVARWLGRGKAAAGHRARRQLAAARLLGRMLPEELEQHGEMLREHPVDGVRSWWATRTRAGGEVVHGVELVRIPGGTFWMGTGEGDTQGYDRERPRHEVALEPFCLAKTPVTNAQYERYLAANPEANKPEYWGARNYNQPQQSVTGISWHDAQAYCEWAGLLLPTEAQWEYACRAKTQTRYWSGDEESDLARVGWYKGNSKERLHVVAELEANPWGLHDMHGNVWEWCLDGTSETSFEPYTTSVRAGDGLRREPGDGRRVVRGGSWFYVARSARSAFRGGSWPGVRFWSIGFRPAQGIS